MLGKINTGLALADFGGLGLPPSKVHELMLENEQLK
jgi:hypothetical protein